MYCPFGEAQSNGPHLVEVEAMQYDSVLRCGWPGLGVCGDDSAAHPLSAVRITENFAGGRGVIDAELESSTERECFGGR